MCRIARFGLAGIACSDKHVDACASLGEASAPLWASP